MSRKRIFVVVTVISIVAFVSVLAATRSDKPASSQTDVAELVDTDNNQLNFDSFKGKVVFVNNWASWCPPCIAEMPTIETLKNKLKDEDIAFVMVSFDDNPDKAKSFVKKKGYSFQVYFPGGRYPFPTSSIPSTFILDKSGKVVSQHMGMADYSGDELANQLKQLADE